MDNVLNRPMFRRREARDRLNDIAGVQQFAVGGPVFESAGRQPVRPEGLPTNWRGAATMTGGVPSPVVENLNFEPVVLNPGTTMAQQFLYDKNTGQVRNSDGSHLPSSAEAAISEALRGQEEVSAGTGLASLRRESDRLREESIGMMGLGEGASGVMLAKKSGDLRDQLPEAEAAYESAASRTPFRDITPRGILATEGPEGVPQLSPEEADIFDQLSRAAEGPAFERRGRQGTSPGPSPSGAAAPGGKPLTTPKAAPQEGPSFERTGRQGSLVANPMEVAAGLNAPEPEVREKTAADFMKEFTDMAPKYEGADRNLMLAQIGFAIAAGDSPDAMQNIANGLMSGSEMFLKDKAAKAEFDRQLQLSAMQYGLQEKAKEKEASRNGSFFVAAQPVKIGGRSYQIGESVYVPNSVLWEGGVPEGLTTEAMADAVGRNKAALDKALVEAEAAKRISVSEFNTLNEQLNAAAESFESNRALRPLVEASIQRAANGAVTGVNAGLVEWTNKAANAVGVDLGKAYEDPEQYKKDMLKVGNRLIQEILRESGRTVSNVDRELVSQMVGQINDSYAQFSTDPDILVGTLQDILKIIDQNEQAALEQYRTVTDATSGLYSPSGTTLSLSQRANRVFEQTAPIDMTDLFSYDEATGVWKPKVQ